MNEPSIPQAASFNLNRGYEQQLLNLIPPDAAFVVELGCGEGRLGARYKCRHPSGHYTGIEKGKGKVDTAKNLLDRVIDAKPSPRSIEEAGINKVDCLISYGHLLSTKTPWKDINRLSSVINDNGVLLIVFENAANWFYARDLFFKPSQSIAGISPATHVNPGFTLETIQDIFQRSGLNVLEIVGVGEAGTEYQKFLQAAREILNIYDTDVAAFTNRCAPQKYIVRAVKKAPGKHMFIQSLFLPPIAACNDKRVHEPLACLRTISGVRTVARENKIGIAKVKANEPRILLWQRPIMNWSSHPDRLRELYRAGYLVIVEFDDDPRRWQEIVDNDYLTFTGVHAVQTSTEKLAEFLRQFNPNVAVFPNQILELGQKKTIDDNEKVKLFFGALNRENDWQPLLPTLNRILKEYDQEIKVIVVHDRNFFEALDTENKQFQPLCDYARYQELLNGCDIGLLPLEPTEFNQYKSDLKFIEFAAHGVVSLASPCIYESSIQEGETGMIFHNADEFGEKLRTLLLDKDTRHKISANAYQWVAENRLLGQHYRDRYAWYQQLLNKLPQLNRELQQRVPKLFHN